MLDRSLEEQLGLTLHSELCAVRVRMHFELFEACVFSVTASRLCRTMWFTCSAYAAEFGEPNLVTVKFGLHVQSWFAVLFRF